MIKNENEFQNFFPIQLRVLKDKIFLLLRKLPEEVFQAPFFFEGVEKLVETKNKPNHRLCLLEELEDHFQTYENVKLTGIIYQLSRCGSTLVAQTLSQLNASRTLSEPGILNALILLKKKNLISEEQAVRLLKVIVALWSQDSEQQKINHLFIKCSSWHTSSYSLFSQIFPKTPNIFIIRNPVEIMQSILEGPSQVIKDFHKNPNQAAQRVNISKEKIKEISFEDYIAISINQNIRYILKNFTSNTLIINHLDLPQAIFNQIIPHFKLRPGSQEIKNMLQRTLFYGKRNNQKYQNDTTTKLSKVTLKMRKAVEKYTIENYQEINKKRNIQT